MRVRKADSAADQRNAFLGSIGLPALHTLRDTLNDVQLAARGLTLWDAAPSKVERDVPQWNGVLQWAGA
jgi:chromosome partitioning protein